METAEITGIILAGGRSSRMGQDKALLPFRGKPLISYAIDNLAEVCSQIMISSNHPAHDFEGCERWPDEIEIQAPMAGLYSCLKRTKTEYNILLSCDMPFADHRLFRYLLDRTGGMDAVVPVNREGFPEPLCAIYHRRLAGPLHQKIVRHELGMQQFLKSVNSLFVPVDEHLDFYDHRWFVNINTTGEWNKWNNFA